MKQTSLFSTCVQAYWQAQIGANRVFANAHFELFLQENLEEEFRMMLLEFADHPACGVMRAELFAQLPLEELQQLDFNQFKAVLAHLGIHLHGADKVFYFSEEEQTNLAGVKALAHIRPLSVADAVAFATFEANATEEDLDAASVALAEKLKLRLFALWDVSVKEE